MKKHLKTYLVPHSDNDHRPHLLRTEGFILAVVVLCLVFVFSLIHVRILQNGIGSLAAVVSSVLVDLANEDRTSRDLSTLTRNPILEQAAQLKADDMARESYFAHTSPGGEEPWYWFQEAGYTFRHAGENLAVHFTDSGAAQRAWMDSPTHRGNILNEDFAEIGIATARGVYQGKRTVFVVQMFGTPRNDRVAVTVPLEVVSVETQTTDEVVSPPNVAPATFGTREVFGQEEPVIVKVAEPQEEQQPEVEHVQEVFSETPLEKAPKALASVQGVSQSSWWGSLLSQPQMLLSYLYGLLGALIVAVVILTVTIRLRKQHPHALVYGVLLITLIGSLWYVGTLLITSSVLIV